MSNKLKNQKDAPLASLPGQPKKEFNLTQTEARILSFNLSVLSDFENTSLLALRKIYKNVSAVNAKIKENQEDQAVIDARGQVLFKADSKATEEQKEAFIAESKAFSEELIPVELFTLNVSDFPDDRSKFGKRNYHFGQGRQEEVGYVSSYLDLIEAGVIEE